MFQGLSMTSANQNSDACGTQEHSLYANFENDLPTYNLEANHSPKRGEKHFFFFYR